MATDPQIILASGSRHRAALLDRLGLAYTVRRPDVDETRQGAEAPRDYVLRLSVDKARAGATKGARELVIGSDQAAVLDTEVLGKPGDHEHAVEQLRRVSGRTVRFLTGSASLTA